MIRAFCCFGIFITLIVSFLYSGIVLLKNAERDESAWIVNGTSIHTTQNCVHESCYDVYTVHIHGYKYINTTISNYCIYTKYYQYEDAATECKNHYFDGSVHYWENDGHECYTKTRTITVAIILMVIGSFLALAFLCIASSNLYKYYEKQDTSDVIEIPLMMA